MIDIIIEKDKFAEQIPLLLESIDQLDESTKEKLRMLSCGGIVNGHNVVGKYDTDVLKPYQLTIMNSPKGFSIAVWFEDKYGYSDCEFLKRVTILPC